MQKVPLPDYREISLPIAIVSIKDYIEPLLYQLGYVRDDEEIIKLEHENIAGDIWITIKLKKHQQVDLVKHI